MLFTIKVMIVWVGMSNSMGMGISIMGVCKCMLMLMGVPSDQRVHHHENRSYRHDQEGYHISNR